MREALGFYGFLIFYPIIHLLKIPFAKTPKTGARTTIYCAVEPSLEHSSEVFFEYVFSIRRYIFKKSSIYFYFRNCTPSKHTALCTDDGIADQLWQLSIEAVGLK